jgi:hypothetical protein
MWGLTSAAVALLAAGCFRPHPATGSPCTTNDECPDGLVCSHGACEVTLAGDDAAPADDAMTDAASDAAPGGPMHVQQVIASADRAATLDATLPAAPSAGNVLLMIGANQHTSLTSVTGGGTWTKIAGSDENANIEVWYAVADGSRSPVSLDCTLSGCETQPIWMNLTEWSGLAAQNLVEAGISTSGVTSPVHVASVTTSSPHDLIVFAFADGAPNVVGVPGPGNWIALDEVAPVAITQFAWYRIVTPGTYAPTVTETANGWDAAFVILRAP